MPISNDEVKAIAQLARISFDASDVSEYADRLSRILGFVDQMNSVDTQGVDPIAHPLELSGRSRTDEVTDRDQRETFQEQAPEVEKGLYLVPKVIE